MIPVAPGAHYSCGGILADLDGRTSLPGLYAAGEAASTGVQGANRLASNSVTEAIIAGRRTGAAVAGAVLTGTVLTGAVLTGDRGTGCGSAGISPTVRRPGRPLLGGAPTLADRRQALAQAMSRYAGVIRDADGLARLLRVITQAARHRAGSKVARGLDSSARRCLRGRGP